MRTLRQRPALSTPQCPRVSRRPSVRAHFPYRPPRKGTPHPAAIRPARNPSHSIRALSPFPRKSGMSPLFSEHEEGGANQAKPGPQEIELQRLLHIEECEWHEHRERNDFLHHLELAERHRGVADAIRRNLQQVFEQRDAP